MKYLCLYKLNIFLFLADVEMSMLVRLMCTILLKKYFKCIYKFLFHVIKKMIPGDTLQYAYLKEISHLKLNLIINTKKYVDMKPLVYVGLTFVVF